MGQRIESERALIKHSIGPDCETGINNKQQYTGNIIPQLWCHGDLNKC